jgi:hypothetical protein
MAEMKNYFHINYHPNNIFHFPGLPLLYHRTAPLSNGKKVAEWRYNQLFLQLFNLFAKRTAGERTVSQTL